MSKKVVKSVVVYERTDRPGVWTFNAVPIGGKSKGGSYKSKAEATKAMVDAVNNFNKGLIVTPVAVTSCETAAAEFLAEQEERAADGEISNSHMAEIRRSIKFCMKIKIDASPVAKHNIDALMQQQNRAKVGRALMKGIKAEKRSKATAEKRVKFLKMLLNYAVTKGWGGVNPLDKLSLGLSSEISDRAPRIQPENVQKIVKYLFTEGLDSETLLVRAMLMTAIASGIRQGELRALPWRNVDFDDMCIRVDQAVKHGNVAKVKDPKTKRGFRTVPVPAEVIATLRELKLASKFSGADDYVFANNAGSVPLKKVFPKIMQRVCGQANIPLMMWSDFRHFFASVQISALGEDWGEVAGLMGHSNPSFTYRQYSHYVKNERKQDAARSAASEAMFG